MEPITFGVAIVSLVIGSMSTAAFIKWEDILIALQGKKIAVIGARETGKTTLLNYITADYLIEKYQQTVTPTDTKKRRFNRDGMDIKIKKTRDVGGGKEDYLEWKQLVIESNLIFYLVRADKLLQRDLTTEQRVEGDMNNLVKWIQNQKLPPQVFIIGTHCDLDPEFKNLLPNNVGNYVDRFKQLPSVTKMIVLGSKFSIQFKVAIGSFENEQLANQLISQIFQQVLKK